jgi:hypothetical protein
MPHGPGVDNCCSKGRQFDLWGEQISNSDFPVQSAVAVSPILCRCGRFRSRADGDDGDGDDGDGDGVGDGYHSTRSS